ncbi:MAG: hypothetical protein K2K60_07070 [Clostridia bacterium]|nr:hypothetical protein [Clostridia bacterium]
MKKFLAALAVAVVLWGCIAGISACSYEKYHKISSVQEMYGIEGGKNYELTCDIDFAGQLWSPLPVRNFKGNGHKICNANVNGLYGDYDNKAGFFAEAYGISNVVFENISVTATFPTSAEGIICGGIVCGYGEHYGSNSLNLENIIVKNCSIVISSLAKYNMYIGGICGYSSLETTDCKVENCTITVVAAKSSNSWLHVGGLIGNSYNKNISDCKFINSTLNCTGLSYVNVGGIVGEMRNGGGNILNCTAADNEISLDTTDGAYSCRLGSIAGNVDSDRSEIENIGAKGNTLTVQARQSYTVGGVIGRCLGTVKNSLGDGNSITASLAVNDDKSAAYVGGFAGSNYGSVSRCVVQNCTVKGTQFGTSYQTSIGANKFTSGFAGYSTGSLAYCGINNNSVSGGLDYSFTPRQDCIFNCLLDANESEWEKVINNLNLDLNLWSYENGLKLNILES